MTMRALMATIVLMFGLSSPLIAEDAKPAGDPVRIAAARDLMEVTGVTKQLDGMMEALSKGFAKGAKADTSEKGKKLAEEMETSLKKFMSYKEEMLNDFAVLYAETFTAEEMKSVADFYRSGTGAKFIQLTPQLMQKGAAIGMKYSERAAKELGAAGAPK